MSPDPSSRPCDLPWSRREFIKTTGLAVGAASLLGATGTLGAAQGTSPKPGSKLRIAIVGVGGRGVHHVRAYAKEHIVAFCDVNRSTVNNTGLGWYTTIKEPLERFPDVPLFEDFRVMLQKMGDSIDAVSIATPDHMHFPIAKACIEAGKHVLVEKPLTHTVWEARELLRLAQKHGVVTQMGNQGHANEGTRLVREWVQAGVLGEIREVFHWTNRPVWEQGPRRIDHSNGAPKIPKELNWNLWQGVAKEQAYDPAYLPFEWRGWWEYGCGALGDMACHVMDSAFWALDLGYPETIEASATSFNEWSAPKTSHVIYQFPARGAMPPVTVHWFDGDLKPPIPAHVPRDFDFGTSGTFLVGSEMTAHTPEYSESVRLYPTEKFMEVRPKLPPKTIPRIKDSNHFQEFIDACKGGPACGSRFEYSAPFTETVLLGNIAIRAKQRLEYDAKRAQFTNSDYANSLLTKSYRSF